MLAQAATGIECWCSRVAASTRRKNQLDVTVPGGLDTNANVLATLQTKRAKVHVLAARPNYPTTGKMRIDVSDVASTTVFDAHRLVRARVDLGGLSQRRR